MMRLAQGDGHRPHLPYGQGLHLLVGAQVSPQHLRVEQAVGVGHVGPGHAEHPRIAGKGTGGQFGQLSVVTARQVGPNLANLGLNHIEVVDQPLGGGRNRRTAVHRLADVLVGGHQHRLVFGQPRPQLGAALHSQGHDLRRGQAAGVFFQPLDSEQLGPDGGRIVPGRIGPSLTEQPPQGRYQCLPSTKSALICERIGPGEHQLWTVDHA
jgi:hypothetical protein